MKYYPKMCYEKEYCYFCNKKDCDKRLCSQNIDIKNLKDCNGDCYNCIYAFSNLTLSNLVYFNSIGMDTKPCLIYKLIKSKSTKFYGMTSMPKSSSKIECAIHQLEKCQKCKDEKVYTNLLIQILDKIEQIPSCYESMTDLTSKKCLENVKYSILEVLSNNYECKVKIELKRVVNEYLTLSKDNDIDLEKLCEYINLRKINVDYYIHPVTIIKILLELQKENKMLIKYCKK